MAVEVISIPPVAGPAAPSSTSMLVWRVRRNPKALVGLAIIIVLLTMIAFAPLIAPQDPLFGDLSATNAEPGERFLLGADKNGRDVLSRLIYGTRTALGGAIAVVLI